MLRRGICALLLCCMGCLQGAAKKYSLQRSHSFPSLPMRNVRESYATSSSSSLSSSSFSSSCASSSSSSFSFSSASSSMGTGQENTQRTIPSVYTAGCAEEKLVQHNVSLSAALRQASESYVVAHQQDISNVIYNAFTPQRYSLAGAAVLWSVAALQRYQNSSSRLSPYLQWGSLCSALYVAGRTTVPVIKAMCDAYVCRTLGGFSERMIKVWESYPSDDIQQQLYEYSEKLRAFEEQIVKITENYGTGTVIQDSNQLLEQIRVELRRQNEAVKILQERNQRRLSDHSDIIRMHGDRLSEQAELTAALQSCIDTFEKRLSDVREKIQALGDEGQLVCKGADELFQSLRDYLERQTPYDQMRDLQRQASKFVQKPRSLNSSPGSSLRSSAAQSRNPSPRSNKISPKNEKAGDQNKGRNEDSD